MRIDRPVYSTPIDRPRLLPPDLGAPTADMQPIFALPEGAPRTPIERPTPEGRLTPRSSAIVEQLTQMISQLLEIVRELMGRVLDQRPPPATDAPAEGTPGAQAPAGGATPGEAAPDAKLQDIGGREAVRVDGPNGFLWKPISDGGQHKLVVLLPEKITARAKSVVIKDENGRVLERARQKGDFNGRGIYRFKKEGGAYPHNSTVEVTLDDGRVKTYRIGDTSLRHD